MTDVAIVEDHRLLAETLAAALNQRGVSADVVELCEPADLLAQLRDRRPGLVVLDLDLGEFGDSTWLIEPLTAAGISVFIVTGSGNRLRVATALEQGAIGYQPKSTDFDTLLAQVETAVQGGAALNPAERAELLDELGQSRIERARRLEPFARLTERERETLQALANGRTVTELARAWVLSEATVRTHVRTVLAKLNVPSQLAAVSMALRSGWIDATAQTVGMTTPEHPLRRATDVAG